MFEDDKQVIVVVEEKERERMEGQLRLGGKKIADHPSHVDSTVHSTRPIPPWCSVCIFVVVYVLHVYLGPILGDGKERVGDESS